MTILPFSGRAYDSAERQASSYRLKDAVIQPNYLEATLLRYGVRFKMSPTERGAIFIFEFSGDDAPKVGFYFDGTHDLQAVGDFGVSGYSGYSKEPVPEGYGLSFIGEFSEKPVRVVRCGWGGYAEFAAGTRRVELRFSGSFIDTDQARLAMDRELGGRSFEDIEATGAAIWNELLGRIEIEDESERQERIFYSCLYRCLLFPRFLDELDASGETYHRSPYDGKVRSGSLCADSGFWDVYRTLYPLLVLVYPEVLRRMLDGWLSACRESGWAPKWPSPGPRLCMIGTHFDVFVADVVAKGITDWDVEAAFEYLWKNASRESDDPHFGREGLKDFSDLGYVAADRHDHAAACTLDYAYNDFCVAQVARFLGKTEEADMLLRRARNYRNVFDPAVGFMRGRNADGTWLEPFREFEWGGAFIEGSTWQHTLNVPHDPEGLAELLGGPEALCQKLDTMLSIEPRFEAGSYDFEIHEASEMAAADFGQYAHSNQPVHGFLFLYALMGQPEKTVEWVHRVCKELYSPDKFPGDEDNGEMSAWYIWACLGLFPQCPGKAEYVCFEPLLKKLKIHLPDGPPLLLGRVHHSDTLRISHDELLQRSVVGSGV